MNVPTNCKTETFSPEKELLFCCARVKLTPENVVRRDQLLAGVLDWKEILLQATLHGLRPLLHWHLRDAGKRVPSAVRETLNGFFLNNAQFSLHFAGELARISLALEKASIPVLCTKGPVLALGIYGNLALREYGDLDLLVRRQDMARAREVLADHGYRDRSPMTKAQEAAIGRARCARVLQDKAGKVDVDLHCAVAPAHFCKGLDGDTLIGRSVERPFLSHGLRALAPEDEVLVVAVHGAKHGWARIKWLCDFAEAIRAHQSLDWPLLLKRVDALGLRRLLGLGLHLAHDLLHMPMPGQVRTPVTDERAIACLANKVSQNVFGARPPEKHLSISMTLFHLRNRERWRDRARHIFLISTSPTEEDIRLWPLPTSLNLLRWFLRPIRLVVRYGFGRTRRRAGTPDLLSR